MFTRIYLFFKYLAFKRKARKKAKHGVCQISCLEIEIKKLRAKNSEYYLKNQELELFIQDLQKEIDSLKYMITNPEQKRLFSKIGSQSLKQAV
jgi:FtsZ-binding cell division protein ZapB